MIEITLLKVRGLSRYNAELVSPIYSTLEKKIYSFYYIYALMRFCILFILIHEARLKLIYEQCISFKCLI